MARTRFASLACLIGLLCTLTARAETRGDAMPYPLLPEAISSFGAVVTDGWIYVFGGHAGRLPGNSKDGLSPHFCRINLASPGTAWEALPMHITSQSPGLVTWQGAIYRVGGLSFKNAAGDPTEFHSLSTFAKFDPTTKTWTDLPSLPVPRSSLDAAVVDGKLYVVGGWNLQEGTAQDATWHDTALVYDLSQDQGAWKEIAKPPFSTRALATAGHQNKLYVMGGMSSDNQITRAVHIYDPKSDTWSAGPELAGSEGLSGFAISAYVADGVLYYSGSEGIVYKLSPEGTAWTSIERLLFPRSFHRLVADGGKVVAIAGVARGGGYLANLEVIDLTAGVVPKQVEWSVDFGGKVKQGQALYLSGSSLYAFGGNRTTEPHNFSKEAFSDEAYKFDLAARSVEKLPNLAKPTQGGYAYQEGPRIDPSIYVLGGLTYDDKGFHSADTIFQYRLRSKDWMEEVGHLPTTRAMFSATPYQGELFIFGGSRVKTDDQGLVAETWRWKPGSEEPAATEASIPTLRRSFGGARLGEKYFVVGGIGDAGIVSEAEVFDLTTKQWSKIASPLQPRVFPSLVAVGGKLYLAGGFASVDGHFAPAKNVEVYDPASDKWEVAMENPLFMDRAGAVIEFQDRLLFYGIDREKEGVAHFVVLDPTPQAASFGQAATPAPEVTVVDDQLARLMRLDANKDGQLSTEEVTGRFRRIVERADANKDGVATREELEKAVQSMQPVTEGRPRRN